MARTVQHVHNPDYPPDRVIPGVIANLLKNDWNEMTRAANASSRHVKSMDRWIAKAREANPNLTDDQAARLAAMLRKQHYIRMGRLSGQARKLAREARLELDAAGEGA